MRYEIRKCFFPNDLYQIMQCIKYVLQFRVSPRDLLIPKSKYSQLVSNLRKKLLSLFLSLFVFYIHFYHSHFIRISIWGDHDIGTLAWKLRSPPMSFVITKMLLRKYQALPNVICY